MMVPFFFQGRGLANLAWQEKAFVVGIDKLVGIDRYRRESLRWLACTVCNVITKPFDFLFQKKRKRKE